MTSGPGTAHKPNIDGAREVPKSGALNRLKTTPKDAIPISKTPRRQRSSRFHVTERVELEKLVSFKGFYFYFYYYYYYTSTQKD